jgi:predicted nucleotidyltransferase
MSTVEPLPGTAQHQALLQRIVDAYAHDERVLAIGVLGSIARGTWDQWSDLDLDIIVNTAVDALVEGRRLGGPRALVLPTRADEVDVVLESLEEFSIRFHPLGTTNAHIAEDLTVIAGLLDRAAVLAAGVVQTRPARTLEQIASEALRFAIGVDIACQRGQGWIALWLLGDVRARLRELFSMSRALARPIHGFQAHAPRTLDSLLRRTVAGPDVDDVRQALGSALDVLEHDLAELTDARCELSAAQRGVLDALRQRMAAA